MTTIAATGVLRECSTTTGSDDPFSLGPLLRYWVLACHGGDQGPDPTVHAWTSQWIAPAPEETPALAVPGRHGRGPDQEEVASPVPVETANEEPEELVTGAEAGPGLATEGDLKLLAEEQVLEEEATAAAEDAGEGSEEEAEEFDHPRQDRRSSHSGG